MEIEKLLYQAKQGEAGAKEELFLQYRPLLLKYAMIDGRFNEDLYQELSITFLHCIQMFDMDRAKIGRK